MFQRDVLVKPTDGFRETTWIGALLCALLLTACQAGGLVTEGPNPNPNVPRACTPALFNPFRLSIDTKQSNRVSGTFLPDGPMFEIEWPEGFTLQLQPDLAVVDPTGKIVARDGQIIEDAGGSGGGAEGGPAFICAIGGKVYS
jgi:hypothetical protein